MLLDHEPALRLGIFAAVFVPLALAEIRWPRRAPSAGRSARWPGNLGILALDVLAVRLLSPLTVVAAAALAQEQGWGLLQVFPLPFLVAVVLSLALLDLLLYAQHVVFHKVPWLWRVHRMHHADLQFDVTTALRFHPLEILISTALKLLVVVALGAPTLAVLLFEILLNSSAMFNHSNVRIPVPWDALIRRLLVTPDMHRVHHSTDLSESNRNFGFALSWWDRLFGTYQEQPAAGHRGMAIGLDGFRSPRDCSTLTGMLMLPFRKAPAADGDPAKPARPDSSYRCR